ncbi:uncharacterized protein LOC106408345 [Brassica napus]|uniref:uncharacterized protein LOC106408345 n=1 Tax=Brassica napus TaxID=3708 RepID=UPI0006AB33A6|nr:uncharacterized protein LOC106408345 [Brassica napus]
MQLRCQVDASWTHEDRKTGLGFVLMEEDQTVLVGLQNVIKTPSPIHAEVRGLLWAMKTLKNRGFDSMHFETDCLQLLKLIRCEDEWPSMATEIEDIWLQSKLYTSFSISFLPRGKNTRADCFAKAARNRTDAFVYVSNDTPVWLAQVARSLE